jgi:hypothetical protein
MSGFSEFFDLPVMSQPLNFEEQILRFLLVEDLVFVPDIFGQRVVRVCCERRIQRELVP